VLCRCRIRLSYRDEVNVLRPVLAGVVTALVGFGGAFPVVLAGAAGSRRDERQAASGLLAVCLASGIVAVVLGLRTRMPVSIAQSLSCESTPWRSKAEAHRWSDGRPLEPPCSSPQGRSRVASQRRSARSCCAGH
jgi:hypothetical protein